MYIRVDKDGRVTELYNQEHEKTISTDWEPDGSLMDDRYVYKYKLSEGNVVNRTQDEMEADYNGFPASYPDYLLRITALEERNRQLEEALDLLLSGVTE